MKEELTQVTVEAMKGLMENLTQAKGFILEQAPDVLKEMVLIERIQMTTVFCFAVAMMCSTPYFFKRYKYWMQQYKKLSHPECREADAASELFGFLALFAGGVGTLVAVLSFFPLVTVWFAPKVYLLGEISKLLK